MNSLTVSTELTLDLVTCCVCGTIFGMNNGMNRELMRVGGSFYCPAGHQQHYGQTEMDKLKKKLASEKEQSRILAARLDNEKARLKQTEASLRGTKAALTKVKKRVANGVCPCCHRSFQKLRDHMRAKHPDYIEE